jgi:hypothetical protein
MKEAIYSSKKSVLARTWWCHIPETGILDSHVVLVKNPLLRKEVGNGVL